MASASTTPRLSAADTAIGLLLAALIIGSWLTVHVVAIFVIDWSAPGMWWAAPIVVALQCWLSVGLFIVAHDSMHGSLAPQVPALNRAIGRFCVFIYAGFSYDKLLKSHKDHHRYAGTPEDPDFDVENAGKFWPWWYVSFFRHYFGWRELAILTVAVILYALVLGPRFPLILLFWALPALLSSVQLFYFGTYRPHRIDDLPFTDRHNARSDDFPPWLSLLTCFHFGYHHEHHDTPWVPWWRLPERHFALRTTQQAAE